jgi:hypothetical protein
LIPAEPNWRRSFSFSTTTPGVPGVNAGVALLGISKVVWENILAGGSGVGTGITLLLLLPSAQPSKKVGSRNQQEILEKTRMENKSPVILRSNSFTLSAVKRPAARKYNCKTRAGLPWAGKAGHAARGNPGESTS